MGKYIYIPDGSEVEVLSRYLGLWIYKKGTVKGQGNPKDFRPVNQAEVIPLKKEGASVETPSQEEEERVNVNQQSLTKDELAKKVKGIGKMYASRILQARPVTGYKTWEELIELNSGLSVDWDALKADGILTIGEVQ